MFDFVRKHTKIMMVVMFLLIIPSFVLFGIDGYNRMGNHDVVVARVAGQDITQSQWDAAHKSESDRLRASMPKLDAKLLDTPQMRHATLEQLVRDRVLSSSAEKSRLMASDARLARFLQENSTIASLRKSDGKIDMDRYRQLAASQGFTTEGFERNVRSNISKQQVEEGVRSSGFATPVLADVSLNAYYEKREVQVANFLTTDYASKVNPVQADLEAFYKDNQSLFQAPEEAQIEYVVLDLETVKQSILVPEADLRAYYAQNVARLSGNEERRASHILINAPKDASAADRQDAKSKAMALLRSVRTAPKSFADVAKKNSQDPGSANKSGDLGFFPRGTMVKPFEEAVFSMKEGEISKVIESDFGYHIIKLTGIKVPEQRSFNELRQSMEADIKTQQAQRKYAEVAELFTNTVYEQSDSLKPAADKLKLNVVTADHVGRQATANSKGVLANDKFLDALFSADSISKKRNTEAIETGASQLAAGRVLAYSPARILPLAQVLDQVRSRVINKQALALAKKDGNEKLAIWKKDPASAVLPTPVVISRDQSQKLPLPVVTAAMRSGTSALPTLMGVDLVDQGYAIVKVNKIVSRSEAATASQDRNQYAQWWTAAEGDAFYAVLKKQSKTEILVPN